MAMTTMAPITDLIINNIESYPAIFHVSMETLKRSFVAHIRCHTDHIRYISIEQTTVLRQTQAGPIIRCWPQQELLYPASGWCLFLKGVGQLQIRKNRLEWDALPKGKLPHFRHRIRNTIKFHGIDNHVSGKLLQLRKTNSLRTILLRRSRCQGLPELLQDEQTMHQMPISFQVPDLHHRIRGRL